MNSKRSFIRNECGAISIEAGFYFLIYAFIMAIFIDFSIAYMSKSKLDRVSASAVSILRERTHFYDENPDVSQQESDRISIIIKNMLDIDLLSLSVAYARKDGNGNLVTQVYSYNEVSACSEITRNEFTEKLFDELSPEITLTDGTKKQYPLYQVRICRPGSESLFAKMIGLGSDKMFLSETVSKNIAIYR